MKTKQSLVTVMGARAKRTFNLMDFLIVNGLATKMGSEENSLKGAGNTFLNMLFKPDNIEIEGEATKRDILRSTDCIEDPEERVRAKAALSTQMDLNEKVLKKRIMEEEKEFGPDLSDTDEEEEKRDINVGNTGNTGKKGGTTNATGTRDNPVDLLNNLKEQGIEGIQPKTDGEKAKPRAEGGQARDLFRK